MSYNLGYSLQTITLPGYYKARDHLREPLEKQTLCVSTNTILQTVTSGLFERSREHQGLALRCPQANNMDLNIYENDVRVLKNSRTRQFYGICLLHRAEKSILAIFLSSNTILNITREVHVPSIQTITLFYHTLWEEHGRRLIRRTFDISLCCSRSSSNTTMAAWLSSISLKFSNSSNIAAMAWSSRSSRCSSISLSSLRLSWLFRIRPTRIIL